MKDYNRGPARKDEDPTTSVWKRIRRSYPLPVIWGGLCEFADREWDIGKMNRIGIPTFLLEVLFRFKNCS
jgi:hypothetical protein